MKRKLVAVVALAMMAPIAMAQAQFKFGLAAGASLPTGDIKDYTETGYHALVTAGIQPPLAPLGFRVDGMFTEMKATTPADSKFQITSLTANGVFSLPGAIVLSPYAIAGVGTYSVKAKSGATSVSNSDFGFNGGVGIKFGLAGFSAFGEVRYHAISNDGTDKIRFIPITFGVMF